MSKPDPDSIPTSGDLQPIYILIFVAPDLKRERKRVDKHNRRARKRGLPFDLTLRQWLIILARHDCECFYCGDPYQTLEHRTPLWRGGGTTSANCVPACIECNGLRDHAMYYLPNVIRKLSRIARHPATSDLYTNYLMWGIGL